ncbi:MAG: DUF2723 domain-containing protein [Anaerolineales bacterium]|nr:DUF2723 domain-containing protein [Anaerolineales bacterium]
MIKKPNTLPLDRTDVFISIFMGLMALALYVRTLAPSLLWGDSAEFQTLSYTLGMTHPSGYMTQIMFGKIFTYLPIGNIAYRVNLMSAFFGALVVAETYLIVRLLGGKRVAGVSASILLMLTEGFWWRALIAESYAPAAGMLTTIWFLVLLWRKTETWQYLFLAGLAGGLSVGIHSTVVMTAASVLIVMILTARTLKDWLGAGAGALLGSLMTFGFFIFLDYKDPPSSIYNTIYRPNLSLFSLQIHEFDTPLERFFAIFPASSFWSYYFTATPDEISRRLLEYILYFPNWVFILIILGAIMLFVSDKWQDALYPLIAFIIIWGFATTVSFSVYREFYVPIWAIVYIWFGIGASAVLSFLERLSIQRQFLTKIIHLILSILLITLPVWYARQDLARSIQSGYPVFVQRYHIYPIYGPDKAILDASRILNRIEDNAILFTNWDKLYSLVYTAHIEYGRTSISLHEWLTDNPELAKSAIEYIDLNIDEHPIYFFIVVPQLPDSFRIEQINDQLYRVYRN